MDNEALTMNVSNNFIHLVPYEMPESLYERLNYTLDINLKTGVAQ